MMGLVSLTTGDSRLSILSLALLLLAGGGLLLFVPESVPEDSVRGDRG
jgi:MFS-type transporter involved in bile tolerance (Atg22 family)